MKISIAMAAYNGGMFLSDQLNSFAAQTKLPDELVVCDDGSTDDTALIVEEFSKRAPFKVCLIKNEYNLGYVKNFEKAITLCSGDIVFLSDQDDVWFSEKISKIISIFKENPNVLLVQSNMLLTDEGLNSSGVSQLENILALGHKCSDFFTGCGIAIRRNLTEIVLPIPNDLWGHDAWINRLARFLGVVQLVEEPLMYYRRHGSNASNWLASNANNLSPWDSFKVHGLSDARRGWIEEWQRLIDLEICLENNEDILNDMGLKSVVSLAIKDLRSQRAFLRRRTEIVSRTRLARVLGVGRLWFHGGYKQFSGWKSVVKDLIRP